MKSVKCSAMERITRGLEQHYFGFLCMNLVEVYKRREKEWTPIAHNGTFSIPFLSNKRKMFSHRKLPIIVTRHTHP